MKNLIIGNTSQLSFFFPKENSDFISSRNIDFVSIKKNKYDKIFITFAEQRTFLNDDLDFFTSVNVDYTLDVINQLYDITNKFIIYSTSELWNNNEGPITLNTEFNYDYSHYIKSKEILCNTIINDEKLRKKVIIIYPFNFNSTFRKEGFLFSKIYDSIKNNKKVFLGNVDFERDLIHPFVVVKHSLECDSDMIIGGGVLINVKKFIEEIFKELHLDINNFIEFGDNDFLPIKRKKYFSSESFCSYEDLLKLTVNDIKNNLK